VRQKIQKKFGNKENNGNIEGAFFYICLRRLFQVFNAIYYELEWGGSVLLGSKTILWLYSKRG